MSIGKKFFEEMKFNICDNYGHCLIENVMVVNFSVRDIIDPPFFEVVIKAKKEIDHDHLCNFNYIFGKNKHNKEIFLEVDKETYSVRDIRISVDHDNYNKNFNCYKSFSDKNFFCNSSFLDIDVLMDYNCFDFNSKNNKDIEYEVVKEIVMIDEERSDILDFE